MRIFKSCMLFFETSKLSNEFQRNCKFTQKSLLERFLSKFQDFRRKSCCCKKSALQIFCKIFREKYLKRGIFRAKFKKNLKDFSQPPKFPKGISEVDRDFVPKKFPKGIFKITNFQIKFQGIL